MTEKNWFYKLQDKHLGPVAVKDLFDLYHQGQIQDETFLWRMGQKDWVPLHQVPELYLALHPEKQTQKSQVVELSRVLPAEDIVRQTRDEIEREIPLPNLEPLTPMGTVPKPPAHFRLDSSSGKSAEVPEFSSEPVPTPGRSFDVPDGPPPISSLGVHETVDAIVLDELPDNDEGHRPAELLTANEKMADGDVVVATKGNNHLAIAVVAFILVGFILSMLSVVGLRLWQWYHPNLQAYPQISLIPEQKKFALSKDGRQLYIRSEIIGTEEAKVELNSAAWYNQSHSPIQLSINAKQTGAWIIIDNLEPGSIPVGIYQINIELWSYDWVTKLLARLTNEAAVLPGAKKVSINWRGQYTNVIDASENISVSATDLLKIQEQYKIRYENEVLAGVRESLLNLKTIQGLWQQMEQTFSESTAMAQFENNYAKNIAPVFQAISQDLQLPNKKLMGQNLLLEICRDFGQAVVLMSDYLASNETLAKIEASKKIKPKKGKKVPVIAPPKKSPDIIQQELRAVSAKIDGAILALQREWDDQIQRKEIKE